MSFTAFLRRLIIQAARVIFRLTMRVSVTGLEHYPARPHAPTILVANHFSWFDAPILTGFLPYPPVFLTAAENLRHPFMRVFIQLYRGIPVRRGQVDRAALNATLEAIAAGRLVAIFPEGGVQPEFATKAGRGEPVNDAYSFLTRRPVRLMQPRAGTAYVAVQSRARIVPVALTGTHTIVAQWRRLRRPHITITVGPCLGPYSLDPHARGPAKRATLDRITQEIMSELATLLPPELRGPYAERDSAPR